MNTAGSLRGPRQWMSSYFEKNRPGLSSRADAREAIAWDNPSALIGIICMGPITDALCCFAGGDTALAQRFLARARWVLHQGIGRFGLDVKRDAIDLDRPRMALASQLGSILAPDLFGEPWLVPFEAFTRFIEADGRLLEEANAGRVLWALYAVLEGAGEEFEAARALALRSHRDLRQEMDFLSALAGLSQDPGNPRWGDFESILARWLNPILKTKSYASNFQDVFAGLLALNWCKYRLRRLDRETMLATYFGETLGVPVVVEE